MAQPLDSAALDTLFNLARTHNTWQRKEVPDRLLRQLYDLMKMGPTAFNCLPARLLFVKSAEAKARLEPALAEGNREKTMAAPVTVIVAYDSHFYQHLPKLFPAFDAKAIYESDAELAAETAVRNGNLQGGYLILAARALGLDAGPMSGFDSGAVDRIFFPDGRYRSNFLVNLGYGDEAGLYPRGPRLSFEETCWIE